MRIDSVMMEKIVFQRLKHVFAYNQLLKNTKLLTVMNLELSRPFLVFIPGDIQNTVLPFCLKICSNYKGMAEVLSIKQQIIDCLEFYHVYHDDLVFKYQSCGLSKDDSKLTSIININFLVNKY